MIITLCINLPMLGLEFVVVLSCKDQSPLEMHLFLFVGS